jgi:hypothetical protein
MLRLMLAKAINGLPSLGVASTPMAESHTLSRTVQGWVMNRSCLGGLREMVPWCGGEKGRHSRDGGQEQDTQGTSESKD